jgi:ferredoxin-like protein FixX
MPGIDRKKRLVRRTKMTYATAVLNQEAMTEARLLNLALISSKTPSAVSVYFQSNPEEGRGNAIRLKDVIREICAEAERNHALESWKKIATVAENWLTEQSALHVLFACPQQAIWEEFELPARRGPVAVDVDTVFHIVPLLRSLQDATTVTVVLVERERARMLAVKNGMTAIDTGELKAERWQTRPHDSRTGWSASSERNREEYAEGFLKTVIQELSQLPDTRPLIIGCRYDIWSELHAHLPAAVENRIIGRFVPLSLEMDAEEVLEHVALVLKEHKTQLKKAVLQKIRDGEGIRAVTGLEKVTAVLAKGAVHELVLASPARQYLYRCSDCGRLNLTATKCLDCETSRLQAIDAEEALAREAMAQGSKITFIDNGALAEWEGVAAFLRY